MVLLPDAGPLITLAYADALDLLFKPKWQAITVTVHLTRIIPLLLYSIQPNSQPEGRQRGQTH